MSDQKSYTCICGKIFDNPQKFNGHKANCKVHLLNKYGNLDSYTESHKRAADKISTSMIQYRASQQQAKLNQWILEQHRCECCDIVMAEYYGSGRFCSSNCAHSYVTSKTRAEISKKTSETLKNRFKGKTKKDISNAQKLNTITNLIDMGYKYVSYPEIDFNDKYMINSEGCIISLNKFKRLKPSIGEDKYVRALLVDKKGKTHNLLVHRIVAYAFIPNPNNYPIINHKDENPSNNSVDNLEWCTYSYNTTYLNRHIERGRKISQTIKAKGGAWNKGMRKSGNISS